MVSVLIDTDENLSRLLTRNGKSLSHQSSNCTQVNSIVYLLSRKVHLYLERKVSSPKIIVIITSQHRKISTRLIDWEAIFRLKCKCKLYFDTISQTVTVKLSLIHLLLWTDIQEQKIQLETNKVLKRKSKSHIMSHAVAL